MGVVHFEDRKDGRTDIMLGVVAVGAIMPVDHAEYRVVWSLTLPSCPAHFRGAPDADGAKAGAIRAVRDWLQAAGLGRRRKWR